MEHDAAWHNVVTDANPLIMLRAMGQPRMVRMLLSESIGGHTMEYALNVSLDRERWTKLDPFTQGYIEAAMWTLTDEDGNSLDYLGMHDISDQAIKSAVADCKAFQSDQAASLQAGQERQNGVDFWLTRNRHGAGFWDRGLGAVGDYLTEEAHAWGESDWYVGDDGLVYTS